MQDNNSASSDQEEIKLNKDSTAKEPVDNIEDGWTIVKRKR